MVFYFTLRMNVHDFVTEPFKLEHIFRDALLISDVGISGTEYSQHPWIRMDKWFGDLSASMESRGRRVWKPGSNHGVPWRAQCGILDILMECHEEFVGVSAHS